MQSTGRGLHDGLLILFADAHRFRRSTGGPVLPGFVYIHIRGRLIGFQPPVKP
jgi:hypothetical protein